MTISYETLKATKSFILGREQYTEQRLKCRTVGSFVELTLDHLNHVADQICQISGKSRRGSIFRIGITYLTPENILVPLPFQSIIQTQKLFIDEYLHMPLEKTTLGPLIASGKSDTIADLPAHFAQRPRSLASQIAIRNGVRSNMRCPYQTLKSQGILFVSANVPHFFDGPIFDYIVDLVPDIEAFLTTADEMATCLDLQQRSVEEKGVIEKNEFLLQRFKWELMPDQLPFEELMHSRLVHFKAAPSLSPNLINTWRLGEKKLAILSIHARSCDLSDVNLVLFLRGMFLKHMTANQSVSEVVFFLFNQYWSFLTANHADFPSQTELSLFFGLLDLQNRSLSFINTGSVHAFCLKQTGQLEPELPKAASFEQLESSMETETLYFQRGDRFILSNWPALNEIQAWPDLLAEQHDQGFDHWADHLQQSLQQKSRNHEDSSLILLQFL
jgi:hypothetical protein